MVLTCLRATHRQAQRLGKRTVFGRVLIISFGLAQVSVDSENKFTFLALRFRLASESHKLAYLVDFEEQKVQ